MNDQHMTVIAMIVQDGLLLANAVLIGWYLYETRKMRKAAEEQVRESEALVVAAEDQLEGQIRPALVAQLAQFGVELVNIGSGPALHVNLAPVPRGSAADLRPAPFAPRPDPIGFLQPGQVCQTQVRVKSSASFPDSPSLDGASLQCTYKSLSGRTHYTVVDFAETEVSDTRFYDATRK